MPNLIELLQLYGVFIVFAIVLVEQGGLPIPAFPILVVSGALAVGGGISVPAVIFMAMAACLIADVFWFKAGRYYGIGVLRLLCKISLSPDTCVSQTEDKFARFGPKSLIVSKFIPGFNIVASPMSGALGVSMPRFIGFSMAGSLLWSATGVALGAYFHKTVDKLLLTMAAMGTTALVVVLSLLGLFVLYKFVERRRVQANRAIARISMEELTGLLGGEQAPLIVDAQYLPTDSQARGRQAAVIGK